MYYRYINSNQYNYEQSFITYILDVFLHQAPTKLSSETTRSPDGGTHSSRSPSMRRYDYITDTCKHTQSRTAINEPARLYTHTKCHTSNDYLDNICTRGFVQMISKPTRDTISSASLLFTWMIISVFSIA